MAAKEKENVAGKPVVGILMGSDTDWAVMKLAAEVLTEFGVATEARVMSAHRTPEDVAEYARSAAGRGLRVVIAGAGGAAHLAGVVAAQTVLPVIGVPVESRALRGLDSLLSMVQMPAGVPVATVGIGAARNAGLLAVQMLAVGDEGLRRKYGEFKKRLAEESRARDAKLAG
jgi:5-(carboxyamino)imidazole ribonucleotide mutase